MPAKTRVAVVGYGNVGRAAVDAVECSNDMTLAGIVEKYRSSGMTAPGGVPLLEDIKPLLERIDVAVVCLPSRMVPEYAGAILEAGVSTVDGFDVHGPELLAMKRRFHEKCLGSGARAIVGAGWDPGTDSMVRAIMVAMAPRGLTSTQWGPGMSMGHSVAARSIPGVRDALSITIPTGSGRHRRHVFVEIEGDAAPSEVASLIRRDPYFERDETVVEFVEDVATLVDQGHRAFIERKGVAGKTHNQIVRYEVLCTNPALTGQIMVSAARAAMRLRPGAYTVIEIPPAFMLNAAIDDAILSLV